MERNVYQDLLLWKNKKNRKPLILNGARQVGKTWILKEFGCHKQFQYSFEDCDTEIILKIDYENPNFIISCFRVGFELKYVHELQHLLNLCKIEIVL